MNKVFLAPDGTRVKRCAMCRIEKPVSEFRIEDFETETPGSYCKKCRSARSSRYHQARKTLEKTFGWENLKQLYGNKCLCCGKREPDVELVPDHVIPLSLGGKSTPDNIQPLCRPCNSKKRMYATDYRD